MSLNLTAEEAFYGFAPDLEPKGRVAQGEEFTLETFDCFGGQLECAADTLDTLDWSRTNPATGPVYIEGTKPGDTLRINLHEVRATGQSVMCVIPGEGGLGHLIEEPETVILKNAPDGVVFRDKITLPAKPMIGVIGVADAKRTIPNSTPDTHGGNMDCTLIGEGAKLYFTVGVEGALFGCGDMHALMGDGEVLICGAETPGIVKASGEVVKTNAIPTPFVETPEVFAAIASAPTADEAQKMATDHMFKFLTEYAGISKNDAATLMSLVGNLIFCQVVDPNITVRFEFPRSVLEELGFGGIA